METMLKQPHSTKTLALALAFAFIVTACTAVAPTVASPTAPAPAEVTGAATLAMPAEAAQPEEAPATDTPLPTASATITPMLEASPTIEASPFLAISPTPEASPTPLPSASPTYPRFPTSNPTFSPPHLTILADSKCYYGPGTAYLLKYGLFALSWMRAMGRTPDGTWLNVKALNDPLWNACWIQTEKVRFDNGSVKDLPVVWMTYPYSVLYGPPNVVKATRNGNVVTISWQPVNMTQDDVRGYLVEAWVCQGGKQVFLPIGRVTSFAGNTGLLSVDVTDEPGCDVPSNARIYGVEKHGYTAYMNIDWPAAESVQTPAVTQPIPTSPATSAPPSGLPQVKILQYSDCLYGPGAFFLYKTSLPAAALMEAVGRSSDGTWLAVEEVNGWNTCWIPAAQASFNAGGIQDLPVLYPSLPHSFWYKPPSPTAHRQGNEVTISWKAIRMAAYDYRGYLIEAFVCQGGQHVYLPVNFVPPYAENSGTLSVTIQDEPGCPQASTAHIYTAEKRGYSGEMIFWPPY
jgi:hypothetical protein